MLLILWLLGKSRPAAQRSGGQSHDPLGLPGADQVSGIRVTVIGEERVPGDTAVLYTGNHRSIFDILITYVRSPRICGYVAKKELGGIPLFSLWARYINCLFFDRKDLKEGMKMILEGTEMLKEENPCLFSRKEPETKMIPTCLCSHSMKEVSAWP